jgi:hypothetical protein
MRKRYFLTVAEALGHQGDNLLFAGSQEAVPGNVKHSQRRNLGDQFEDVVELLSIRPDLSRGNAKQALTQQAEVGVVDGEDAADAGTKCADNQVTVAGFHEQNFGDLGMREMKPANCHHSF